MLNFAQKPGTSTIGKGFFKGNFAWTAWDVNDAEAASTSTSRSGARAAAELAESFAEASNAAHELGHLLGLHHHGAQDTPQQDKDYLSIMSYSFSNFGIPGSGLLPEHHIDYSPTSTRHLDWQRGCRPGRDHFRRPAGGRDS